MTSEPRSASLTQAETRIGSPPETNVEKRNLEFAVQAARLTAASRCEDVLVFDVRGMNDLTDYLVLASGTSDRQIKSVGRDVEELAESNGLARFGRDTDGRGDHETTWLALDFVDVVVHLFDPAARAHYDLEMLWGDAPRIAWRA